MGRDFIDRVRVDMKMILLIVLVILTDSSLWTQLISGRDSSSRVIYIHKYGIDVTFPSQRSLTDQNSVYAVRYNLYLKGCYEMYSRIECDSNERARMDLNSNQPKTQRNYTEKGFKIVKLPQVLVDELHSFYKKNLNRDVLEDWSRGNTYVNHWASRTTVMNFRNRYFRSGNSLIDQMSLSITPIVETWINASVTEVNLYGLRIYHEGAMMATHVDRSPSVIAALIPVAQDLREPWPFEIYNHDGSAVNVTLIPGEMLLYEAHTALHGHPFPMKGRYASYAFAHFLPKDHSGIQKNPTKVLMSGTQLSLDSLWGKQSQTGAAIGGHENTNNNPDRLNFFMHEIAVNHLESILANSTSKSEESVDRTKESESLLNDRRVVAHENIVRPPRGRTDLHTAAARGNYDRCKKLLEVRSDSLISVRDENGWQAIHEAARGGHLDVLRLLLEYDADVSSETLSGETPLWWARRSLPRGHEVIRYLESLHASEGEVENDSLDQWETNDYRDDDA